MRQTQLQGAKKRHTLMYLYALAFKLSSRLSNGNLAPWMRFILIVYLDCIVVKIRQDKKVINKAIYLALGVNLEGHKELLGMWLSENEGAKFWLNVLTELQNRGVKDILIACVEGLKGFPDAINTAFPDTQIQLCIVHMVRNFDEVRALERLQACHG